MGIYIKGTEMPTSCLNCFLSRSGCRSVLKRMRAMEAGTWIPANYRHDDCPLVPVPKHGRLIDADALADIFRGFIAMYDSCPFSQLSFPDKSRRDELQSALAEVINAPTIIPTSEDGE